MTAASTDFHDPKVRALAVTAGAVLYAVFIWPTLSEWSLPRLLGGVAAAVLAIAVVRFQDRLLGGSSEADAPQPAMTVAASVGTILLFEYGLGAIVPGVHDAIAGIVIVAGAGAAGGLLLVGVVSLVRSL